MKTPRKKYSVTGMSCAACSARVEKAARDTAGVTSAEVSLITGILLVEGDFDEKKLFKNIISSGYGINKSRGQDSYKSTYTREAKHLLTKLVISLCFLIPLMYVSMGPMISLPLPSSLGWKKALAVIQMILALAIMAINWKTFVNAARGVIKLSFNMDTLVSLGSVSAFAVSTAGMVGILLSDSPESAMEFHEMIYFDSAAMVLTLVNIGKTLEAVAKGRTTSALDSLSNLRPSTARLADGRTVDISELKLGDVFIVKAGETVATDGKVTNGTGAVNESMITGESLPKDVLVGDGVIGGTILADGYIEVVAEKIGDETMLSGIIKEVEAASSTKAPIGRIADKISGYFALIAIGIALVTFTVWMIVSVDAAKSAIYAACVLVISCPCALGLATPVAITVGIGRSAKSGILIKNAAALEEAGKISRIYFDKTGTLTTGEIKVVTVIGDESVLGPLSALESMSGHPISKAIVTYAGKGEGTVENYEQSYGGLKGIVNGTECVAGNRAFVGVSDDFGNTAEKLAEENGGSVVYAKYGSGVIALVLSDTVKPDAPAVIGKLSSMGIRCGLLTGDGPSAAKAVMLKTGLTEEAHLLKPTDKSAELSRIRESGIVTGFVGDGINDAVALESANVGIAVSGTDVAINASDVVILSNNLNRVPELIGISRKTGRIIRENLFWAFIYNVICIPLAAGAFAWIGVAITPMIGSAAMSLSSLCVVLNSLRIGIRRAKSSGNKNIVKETEIKGVNEMKTVKIEGMMCSHCAAHVKEAFEKSGIEAEVSLEKGEAVLNRDVSDDVIREIVEKAGYTVKQ